MSTEFGGKSFFTERLTRKVPETGEWLLALALALVGAAGIAFSAVYLGGIAIVVAAGVLAAEIYLLPAIIVKEYEYILTDNILDIDMVTAKRSRKRLKSLDIKLLAECGRAEGDVDGAFLCPSRRSDNLYYLKSEKGETVIIAPNEMMLRAFEYYMGRRFNK